jgi:hypothetical protein
MASVVELLQLMLRLVLRLLGPAPNGKAKTSDCDPLEACRENPEMSCRLALVTGRCPYARRDVGNWFSIRWKRWSGR